MKQIIVVLSLMFFLASCSVLDTVSGEKKEDVKTLAKKRLEEAYKNIPKKRKYSNGYLTNKYFVPPHIKKRDYPNWYNKKRVFASEKASLESIMAILLKDENIFSKSDVINQDSESVKTFPFIFNGEIGQALEKLSKITGLSYKVDGDFITWSELETASFQISLPSSVHSFRIGEKEEGQQQQQSSRFGGLSGGGSTQETINNQSFVESSMGQKLDSWDSLYNVVQKMLGTTPGSFVSYDRASSIMVVKAKPKVVKEIRDYVIKVEDSTMTQVVFDFEFIEYRNTSGDKGKLNLNLIKNNFKFGSSNGSFNVKSALTAPLLNDVTPVSVGLNVLSGNWDGSNAIIEALQQSGVTSVLDRRTVKASQKRGGKLVIGRDEYVVTKSSSNVSQIAAQNSTSATVIQLGTEITVVPTIGSNNNIYVELDFKQSSLFDKPIFQNGNEKLQTPIIDKNNTRSDFIAKSGETILISSNSRNKSQYSSHDAGWLSVLLGGSRASTEENIELLVLVTPRIIRPQR